MPQMYKYIRIGEDHGAPTPTLSRHPKQLKGETMSSKPIYQPYSYLIGWSSENKWYYGCRYAKNCHPSDLWKTYFTSSKKVKEFYELHGEPDIVKITKIFTNEKDVRLWEHKVLRRLKVIHRNDFLNQTDNIAISPEIQRGRPRSAKTKQILSEKAKLNFIGEGNPFYGKKHSEETKQKISNSKKGTKSHLPMLGKKHSEETKQKISKACTGNKMPDSMKKKLSDQRKGVPRPKVQCPHCKKIGATGLMHRWHFNNCKAKP